jgi:hypothetical protein
VLDEGYKTPEEAFDKRGLNMTVEIESWALGESPYDGTIYNFVISRNLFEKIGTAEYTGSFVLTTDAPNGWTSVADPGITLTPSSGNGPVTGQTVEFKIDGGTNSPLTIEVTSGPITKRITITRII